MRSREVPRSVAVLTAGLAVGAVGLAVASGTSRTGPVWVPLTLLAILVVAGCLELEFEYRGHVEALDLFEAALMPALVLMPGVRAVALAALAKAISQRWLRVPGVKAWYNVAQWSAATAAGSAVFVATNGLHRHGGSQLAVLTLAMVVGIIVNHLSVVTVLALVNRQSFRQVVAGLESVILVGWLAAGVVNISFGLLYANVAVTLPALLPSFLIPLIVLHWASRGFAEARADRERIRALQRATHELTTPMDRTDSIVAFLDAVRTSFEASAVDFVLLHADRRQHFHSGDIDTRAVTARITAGLDPFSPAARATADDGSIVGDLLAQAGRRVCLCAPVRQGTAMQGWLVSYDRAGFAGFEAGEVWVFDSLASELAGALERFELMEALVDERTHLFDIVDRSSDAIFTISRDGAVETWNPAMEQITGYRVDELGGLGLAQVRPHDATGAEVHFERHVEAGGEGLPGDVVILTRSGAHRLLSCSYATTVGTPSSLVVVARDVTRQREVEQMKDDFVATISHELQTPLTTIMGFTDLLLAEPETLSSGSQREALGIIRKGTRRLGRLISNLLELSVVEAQGRNTDPDRVDVNDVCRDVIDELRDSWPARQITLTPGSGAVMAVGKQLSIEQILSNLIGNALKYAPDSAVRVVVDESADELAIRVEDDGPGIPRSDLERIVDRFERLDHHRVQAGTGLGLYISRQLARSMDGQLTVQSEVGRGTTFTLAVPSEVRLFAVS